MNGLWIISIRISFGDFPDNLVIRTQHFHRYVPGSIPGQGPKILQASWHGQKKKKELSILLAWQSSSKYIKIVKQRYFSICQSASFHNMHM